METIIWKKYTEYFFCGFPDLIWGSLPTCRGGGAAHLAPAIIMFLYTLSDNHTFTQKGGYREIHSDLEKVKCMYKKNTFFLERVYVLKVKIHNNFLYIAIYE